MIRSFGVKFVFYVVQIIMLIVMEVYVWNIDVVVFVKMDFLEGDCYIYEFVKGNFYQDQVFFG